MIPNKVSFGKKIRYFIGYKHDDKVKTLFIMLQKMSGYAVNFSDYNCMCFLIKNDKLFEKIKLDIYGIKSNILSKRDFILKQCIIKKISQN